MFQMHGVIMAGHFVTLFNKFVFFLSPNGLLKAGSSLFVLRSDFKKIKDNQQVPDVTSSVSWDWYACSNVWKNINVLISTCLHPNLLHESIWWVAQDSSSRYMFSLLLRLLQPWSFWTLWLMHNVLKHFKMAVCPGLCMCLFLRDVCKCVVCR